MIFVSFHYYASEKGFGRYPNKDVESFGNDIILEPTGDPLGPYTPQEMLEDMTTELQKNLNVKMGFVNSTITILNWKELHDD